ncbi:hypothetical protein [Desulfosarcina ovata]|uniref:Uncharacterized protein n=2 Tax=Desulfosarcina ovata TaxID=83564 RepID=A0A5K8ABF5_9BACT|nr:hypothetical protein [Desulfosarcina ovata]BBO82166.1 hypothetical protein DSCO28_27320 [Desulfosarcina ovata subsp. sediminis]BBO89374.1 hypothetical protein DSCOOX_25540 [Desulfosarcina ovata subsp. ovata]
MQNEADCCQANPLQKVDQLYAELVSHYDNAKDGEIRAAAKLLIVALEKLQHHGGPDWMCLVNEYIALINDNPRKFDRIIRSQRYPGTSQN